MEKRQPPHPKSPGLKQVDETKLDALMEDLAVNTASTSHSITSQAENTF